MTTQHWTVEWYKQEQRKDARRQFRNASRGAGIALVGAGLATGATLAFGAVAAIPVAIVTCVAIAVASNRPS